MIHLSRNAKSYYATCKLLHAWMGLKKSGKSLLKLSLFCEAGRQGLPSGVRSVDNKGAIRQDFHTVDKYHSLVPSCICSPVINAEHFFFIRGEGDAVVTGACNIAFQPGIFFQNGIIGCLFKRAERAFGSSISHGIIFSCEMIGRIHHVISTCFSEGIRTFGPATVYLPG